MRPFVFEHCQKTEHIHKLFHTVQVNQAVMASISTSTHLSHLSVSSAPELSPGPSAAAGTFPWVLVYPVFEPKSRRKLGCQAASPGCQWSNLRAPPGQYRLPFQESCPGRRHRSSRGERSRIGKVCQFFVFFYILFCFFRTKHINNQYTTIR